MKKTKRQIKGLPVVHPSAAGIDIGSRFHVVAVPPTMSADPVRTFQAFTSERLLGGRFIQSVDTAIAGINENPEAWAEIEQDVRRKLTRVFPYALLYTIEPESILIVAVMHCHKEPGYWRTRLGGG